MKYKIKSVMVVSIVAAMAVLSGCAVPVQGSNTFNAAQANSVQSVQLGHVEATRPVELKGSASGFGALAGGALGAVAGHFLGGGSGKIVTTVVGGIGGVVAGNAIENKMSQSQGVELTIRLDGAGNYVSVTQSVDDKDPIKVGDRVKLVGSNGKYNVSKIPANMMLDKENNIVPVPNVPPTAVVYGPVKVTETHHGNIVKRKLVATSTTTQNGNTTTTTTTTNVPAEVQQNVVVAFPSN